MRTESGAGSNRTFPRLAGLAFALVLAAGAAAAQEDTKAAATPAPAPTPDDTKAAPARLPEGSRIVNLPSAEVPRAGTLSILFTHRFSQPLEDSDFHSLYSFDSGADIGIGLAYAPIENLDVSLYRSSHLDDYELDVKYHALTAGPLSLAVRVGGDWRSERFQDDRNGVFAQAIAAVSIGDRVRITAVPTYVSKTTGERFIRPKPFYKNVWNVPAALSVKVTRSMNVQGEIVPRNGRADSPGVGWIASIEKTVPRHRFAFTVGNLRATTVDQYVASDFLALSPHRYFIGFNLVRQWKL